MTKYVQTEQKDFKNYKYSGRVCEFSGLCVCVRVLMFILMSAYYFCLVCAFIVLLLYMGHVA